MLTQPLLDKLTRLRLGALRVALEEQLQSTQYAELPFEDRLGLLIDRECTQRDNNRLKRRLKTAKLPVPATIEDLKISASRGLDRRVILHLAQGEWIRQHLNILVLGPTGVGKTFLSCALAHSACRYNFTVRYYRTSRLVHQLALAHADGSYPSLLHTFARTQLLVFDDWLRDPLNRSQSQDLLEIVDDRYGRSSTLVATQVPVTDWHARFPDPTIGDAILDRLVHNAYRLELKGESRRKLDSPLPMPTT
ncbi:MAG: IS21-like element helper ATPase IstB [Chloroflexota bacterium]|nr:IS21-like element helper ATPase IstB [Chloroflexota bacterium]